MRDFPSINSTVPSLVSRFPIFSTAEFTFLSSPVNFTTFTVLFLDFYHLLQVTMTRRFETNDIPCENIEDYRPGGFHPVNLEDRFHDGRYEVLRKVGYSTGATVWLARDSQYVRILDLMFGLV